MLAGLTFQVRVDSSPSHATAARGGQQDDGPGHGPQRVLERGQRRPRAVDRLPPRRRTKDSTPLTSTARRRSIRAGVLEKLRCASDRRSAPTAASAGTSASVPVWATYAVTTGNAPQLAANTTSEWMSPRGPRGCTPTTIRFRGRRTGRARSDLDDPGHAEGEGAAPVPPRPRPRDRARRSPCGAAGPAARRGRGRRRRRPGRRRGASRSVRSCRRGAPGRRRSRHSPGSTPCTEDGGSSTSPAGRLAGRRTRPAVRWEAVSGRWLCHCGDAPHHDPAAEAHEADPDVDHSGPAPGLNVQAGG